MHYIEVTLNNNQPVEKAWIIIMEKSDVKTKPKRVVIKIGDVFCVEFDNRFKCYFQCIAKETDPFECEVIRVFKTRYAMSYVPVADDVVADEVDFFAHTPVRDGLLYNTWYKIGESCAVGADALENVLFGIAQKNKLNADGYYESLSPLDNWLIWKVGQKPVEIGRLPEKYHSIIKDGSLYRGSEIKTRVEYGYFKRTDMGYTIMKRHPLPDVDSYMKTSHEAAVYRYHFKGEYVVREVVMIDDEVMRLTPKHPVSGKYYLYTGAFGDVNWFEGDFITAEEFNKAWNSTKCTISRIIGNICKRLGNFVPGKFDI